MAKVPPSVVAQVAAKRDYVPMTFRSSEYEWYGWTNSSGTIAIGWRDCSWPGKPMVIGFESAFCIESGMNPSVGCIRFMTNHGTYAAHIGGYRMEIIPGWPS
jgi:hypothetical protein